MPDLDVFLTACPRTPQRLGYALSTLASWVAAKRAGWIGAGRLCVDDLGGMGAVVLRDVAGRVGLANIVDEWTEHADADAGAWQRERHANAAARADTDWYIAADDDCVAHRTLLVRGDREPEVPWTWEACAALDGTPDLAMVAPTPMPDTVSTLTLAGFLERVTGEPDAARLAALLRLPHEREKVWRVTTVGGIRIVRGGTIPEDVDALPPLDPARGGGYDVTLGQWLRDKVPAGGERCGYLTRVGLTHLGYDASVAYPDGPGPDPWLRTGRTS